MKSLRDLQKKRDDRLLADDWNSLVQQGRARMLDPGVTNTRDPVEDFSWKVTTARLDDLRFKVFVGPGFINDAVPTISYLRNADPRGWKMPDDYPDLSPEDPGYSAYFLDRDLLEEDPPFLLVSVPLDSTGNADFSPVSDNQRIPFFKTADMWEKTIFSARVILTATPLRAAFFPASLPPPPLVRYRLAAVPRPLSASFAALAGGWLEIARLFLVRDEKNGGIFSDRLLVQQREFGNLAASIVTPSMQIAPGMSSPDSSGIGGSLAMGMADTYNSFVSQVQAEIDNILSSTASVEFWTV